ncbi:MAG: DUF885 domain-containing protein [Acidimicrobiales bacterium]
MADVEEVVDAWLAEELARHPVGASDLGLVAYDGQLGDFSAGTFESDPRRTREWAARFADLEHAGRPLEDRIDVALVLATLAGRAALEDWQGWRREPATYLGPCLGGVFSLFLHRSRPEPELVAAAVSRLGQIPAALADGRANLDAGLVPALFAERALGTCRAGQSYLRDALPAEVADEALRADLAGAAGPAADAMASFGDHLADLAETAVGDWRLGEARYSALLRERELLGYGASELNERGEVAWTELDGQMGRLARDIDPGSAGWPEVIASIGRDHPASPEEMRLGYEQACARARSFLAERDLVTLLDDEECLVVPSPVFQRPILAVASYGSPPPLSGSRRGHFFVPFPPEGTTPEALDQRLADNCWSAVPSVAVHEAYPGHHWQLTWSGRSGRPLRHWLRTSYFAEGWALYAEQMMAEEGFFAGRRQEMYHLNMRIFRAARMVVDTALHAGDMSTDDAVAYMRSRAGLTEAVARAEVSRYCAWPTQAPSYLTGALEIERIRDRWRAGPGSGRPLREFHDTLAASPGLPLALAERALAPA